MPETGESECEPIRPEEPEEPWTYTLNIPNDPRAVTICRRTLRLILGIHGLLHLADAAELVATELITNALRHTKGPAAMKVRWADPVLRVTVWDTQPCTPALAMKPRNTAPILESGRGLALVEACAESWGWYRSIRTEEPDRTDGKFVWCELTEAS
ncbi:ATP-binding protein [Streptomyces sp. NPDC002643]